MMADPMSLDASTPPTPSPIVRVLNEEVRTTTAGAPSTLVDQERIEDFYASDVSISAGFFGTLVGHTGVFGEAERFAAAAQGADRTMFSVHGSTGSNFVVLRMLALERPDALVLVARNCHHSTINAIKAFGLDFRFLPSPYDPEFEAVLPPSVDQVVEALRRYPEATAVVYTSPTYEGLCANTNAIAAAVHGFSAHTMLFVDEAWGGHLHFHPDLPPSAMDAGADVSVQSTHKLAGGLQQTGLIHWREARVDSELMEEAFREYVTTEPELPPARLGRRRRALAGGDRPRRARRLHRADARPEGAAARAPAAAAAPGRSRLGRAPPRARRRLRQGQDHRRAERLRPQRLRALRRARRARIVVEKAGINTITLITTFQLEEAAVEATVAALEAILAGRERHDGDAKPMPANPFWAIDDRPVITRTTPAATPRRSARRCRSTRPSAASPPRRSRSTRRASP